MNDPVAAMIAAMRAIGIAPEQILAAVEAHQAKEALIAADRKAKDADRKRKERAAIKETRRPECPVDAMDNMDAKDAVDALDSPSLDKEMSPTPPKEIKPIQPSLRSGSVIVREHARRFYEVYPKHVDPRAAEKKFETLVRSGVDPEHIIAAAARFAAAHRAAGTDKQMIPAPAVWLNKGGYDSEDLPKPFRQEARAGPPHQLEKRNPKVVATLNFLGKSNDRPSPSLHPELPRPDLPAARPEIKLFQEPGRDDGARGLGDIIKGFAIAKRPGSS